MWRKSTQVLQDLSFFGTITGFANHSEWNISLMNPAASNLAISCPIAFLFSEENRLRDSFTGLAFGSTRNLCSTNTLGTPGMSDGFHAKTSQFSRRKWMSSTSYFGSRSIAMLVNLSSSKGWIRTFWFPLPTQMKMTSWDATTRTCQLFSYTLPVQLLLSAGR